MAHSELVTEESRVAEADVDADRVVKEEAELLLLGLEENELDAETVDERD